MNETAGRLRFAYADPPYLGCGRNHYAAYHADAGHFDEVASHAALLNRLRDEFPDGWVVSLHTPSLETYLHMARIIFGQDVVRVGAWVKPFASFKPNVNPGYAWEPILFAGGRKLGREAATVRDYHSAPTTLRRGLTGAKPESFANWVFDLLGMEPADEFHDLFPGSGAVSRAWEKWRNQGRLIT